MDKQQGLNRRDVFKAGVAGAVALGIGASQAQACAGCGCSAKKPGIALQLYSVREACKQDFDKTLDKVAKIGFAAVEFAGYHNYGNNPQGLRKRLDDLGLKVAGTHIRADALVGDTLSETIEFHQAIGCRYLMVPYDKRAFDPEGIQELVDLLNLAAAKLKKYDMYTGYHNHANEFKAFAGKTYWEWLAEHTLRDVILQQDVGWTVHAGHDPVKYVRAYPYRSQVVHCKPTVVGGKGRPILGEDAVNWKPLFAACEEVGGTEWYTLEQEKYLKGKTPMECVEMSYVGMKAILG